jgi:hypothetical protein
MQKAKYDGFGLGSAGILLILPLTPYIVGVCYDGDVCSIENKGGWASIVRIDDVCAINEHQFLKCGNNIYFSEWDDLKQIKTEFAIATPRRLPAWQEVTTASLVSEDELGERYKVIPRSELVMPGKYFINMKAVYPRPQRWPSIVRYRLKPTIFSNGSATGFLRRSGIEADTVVSAPYRKLRFR